MEFIIITVFIFGSAVSGVSYFAIHHTSNKPINGEVQHLQKIDRDIENILNKHI